MPGITITVSAESQAAAAALQQFVNNTANGLKTLENASTEASSGLRTLRESSLLLRESAHGLETSLLLLSGTRFPQLTEAVFALRAAMGVTRTAALLTGATLGATAATIAGVAAAIAVVAIPAWRAYQAQLEQINSEAALGVQTHEMLGRNIKSIQSAAAAGLIKKEDINDLNEMVKHIQDAEKAGNTDLAHRFLEMLQSKMSQFGLTSKAVEDLNTLRRLTQQARLGAIPSGPEGEQLKALEEYKQKLKEVQELAAQNPALAAQKSAAQSALKAEYDQRVATAITEEKKQEAAEQVKQLENGIADYTLENSQRITGNAQHEFEVRVGLYDKLKDQQVISQDEYQRLWDEAYRKRMVGLKNEQHALEEQIKVTQQLIDAREKLSFESVEKQRHDVETNPLLSDTDRANQLLPLLQQQRAMVAQQLIANAAASAQSTDPSEQVNLMRERNQLETQYVDLTRQQQALMAQSSFSMQLAGVVNELRNMNNLAVEGANVFKNVFETAIGSISNAITGLIMGTKTWGQALQQISTSILTSVIQGIVQMGVRWVLTQIMMATMGRAILASAVAATAPMAAAMAAIWSGPATLATIASWGGAALAAPGMIALAETMTAATSLFGFAEGGRPPRGQMSVVGEKGPELFVPDVAGTILPAPITAQILRHGGPGGGSGSGQTNVTIAQFGGQHHAEAWARSQSGQVWFNDMMRQTISRYVQTQRT